MTDSGAALALRPRATAARMRELRRTFHRRPELAYEEVETARTIMAELDRLGIPYEYGGKGGGVVGRLEAAKPGPRIALRAEMDALPCSEETGLPFASAVPGRMHACGHDVHMAMLLGAAAHLAAEPPAGSVVFVFQPAEERGNGAQVMVEAGALDGVDAIFAGHVTTQYRVGEIMVDEGVVTAHSDSFAIHVHGEGGHGARPHEAIDAVVVTGLLITAIQTVVSRHANPVWPCVVTIGSVHAGTAPNIIADHAVLEGIIRTTRADVRERIIDGLRRTASSLGDLYRTRIDVRLGDSCPAVINTPREAAVAAAAARDVVSTDGIVRQEHPSMGAEDFSCLLQDTPGCYVRFGASSDGDYIPLHHPRFDVDEDVLEVGARFFDRAVRRAAAAHRA